MGGRRGRQRPCPPGSPGDGVEREGSRVDRHRTQRDGPGDGEVHGRRRAGERAADQHVKPAPFEYRRAESLEEAVTLLADYEGLARVLAGGQSLVPMLSMRLMRPALIIDINRIPGLDRIAAARAATRIAALVRYSSLDRSPLIGERLPLVMSATRRIGDRQVRNRGTLGGSLSQADPTGEMPLACLALDATVVASSVRGRREIPIDEFLFSSYATTLEPEEMITEIRFPMASDRFAFFERSRKHNDFAVINVAVVGRRGDDGRWSDL